LPKGIIIINHLDKDAAHYPMTTATVDSHAQIVAILELRTIVAALGERSTPPWWRTQFLKDVGLRGLSRVFPRTASSAALGSVLIAAREDHDKRIGIGSGGRYHLFRLPASIEQAIASAMSDASYAPRAASLAAGHSDEFIQHLETIAQPRKTEAAEGPVRIGPCTGILKMDSIASLAGHYADSFRTGRRAFPYFDDVERIA
jgi:hypothetical protein